MAEIPSCSSRAMDADLEPETTGHASEASMPAAIPMPPERKKGSSLKQHSMEEWTAMQPIIVELYIAENHTLTDVMWTLRDLYGFEAT